MLRPGLQIKLYCNFSKVIFAVSEQLFNKIFIKMIPSSRSNLNITIKHQIKVRDILKVNIKDDRATSTNKPKELFFRLLLSSSLIAVKIFVEEL